MVGTGRAWWVVPLACVVLLAVAGVETPAGRPAAAPAGPVARAQPLAGLPDLAVVRDADGSRSQPVPVAALFAGALVLELGRGHAAQPAHLRIWRSGDRGGRAAPLHDLTTPVRADGTVPIAGLADGCYEIEWVGRATARVTVAAGRGAVCVALRAD